MWSAFHRVLFVSVLLAYWTAMVGGTDRHKKYALADIFEALTLPPLTETQSSLLEVIRQQQDEIIPSSTAQPEKFQDREETEIEKINNETVQKAQNHKSKKAGHHHKSKGDSPEKLLKSLVVEYSRDERTKENRRVRKSANLSGPRHCTVSEWGPWSSCSKSCGIGESTRRRRVLTLARSGGNPCPSLEEPKWCGSARDCSYAVTPTLIGLHSLT